MCDLDIYLFSTAVAAEMSDQKPNSWPKFVWGLFALSMLLSCIILISLGWFGLTGSGFTTGFPIWLPGVAVSTIMHAWALGMIMTDFTDRRV